MGAGRRAEAERRLDVALHLVAEIAAAVADAATGDAALAHVIDVLGPEWGVRGLAALGMPYREQATVLAAAGDIDVADPAVSIVDVGASVVSELAVVGGDVTVARTRVLEAVGWVVDARLGRQRLEHALHERVKELSALREVQLALEERGTTERRLARIVDAAAAAMQFPELARAELVLDGDTVVGGATGPFAVRIGADVVVNGTVRGDLQVGYVAPRPFLDPEERNLVHGIARSVGMHAELVEAREDAQAAAARLQRVLETLPSAVFAIDAQLDLEVISVAEHFPSSREPGSVFSLATWDDPLRDTLIDAAQTALAGEPVTDEFDWRDRWWTARVEPLVRGDGTVERALVMLLDATDQHARDEALRALAASEAQFDATARAVTDVIYRLALSPEPHLDYVSPSVGAVTGFEADEILADPVVILRRSHPDDHARLVESLRTPVVGTASFRWRWQRADGRWIWLDDRRSVLEQDGVPVAIVGVVRDVTDEVRQTERTRRALEQEREATEQLRRVDEMKSTFLSAVSHELRTPLTSVLGFAETARRIDADGGDVAPSLERILDNARRLHRLVDDLLDVDRLTRGTITPRREPTDLRAVILQVLARDVATGVHVEHDLDAVTLDVDATMIERVVDNLLRNIQRHTPAGTRAWVRLAASSDGGATIVVEDDGPGIEPELRESIFEPFTQGPSANQAPNPGTGIGLSLVRRFIEVHGGSVTLDERAHGGARFTIVLPAADRIAISD